MTEFTVGYAMMNHNLGQMKDRFERQVFSKEVFADKWETAEYYRFGLLVKLQKLTKKIAI